MVRGACRWVRRPCPMVSTVSVDNHTIIPLLILLDPGRTVGLQAFLSGSDPVLMGNAVESLRAEKWVAEGSLPDLRADVSRAQSRDGQADRLALQ